MPVGLEDVSKYPDLFDRLYESREGEPTWTKEDLEKLAGRNLIRVFEAVEAVSVKIKKKTYPMITITFYNFFTKGARLIIVRIAYRRYYNGTRIIYCTKA